MSDECDHEWVLWSGASRCRKCGTTQWSGWSGT